MADLDYRALCAELVDALAEWRLGGGPPEDTADADLITRARALLDQPVAEGPTDEEIADWHDQCADLTRLGEADHYWAFDLRSDEVAGVVCAALARWGRPTPQPVEVSERLPSAADCDVEDNCWWFDPHADGAWYVDTFQSCYTHWLPANALPTPDQ